MTESFVNRETFSRRGSNLPNPRRPRAITGVDRIGAPDPKRGSSDKVTELILSELRAGERVERDVLRRRVELRTGPGLKPLAFAKALWWCVNAGLIEADVKHQVFQLAPRSCWQHIGLSMDQAAVALESGPLTPSQLAQRLGRTPRTAAKLLQRMVDLGRAERIGYRTYKGVNHAG